MSKIYFDTAPVGTPQEFAAISIDFTNVTLKWAPVECSQRNGPIDGYRLNHYRTYDKLDNKSIIIHGGGSRTFTIAGLQPRFNYTFTIEAINQNYTSFGPHTRTTVVMSVPKSMSTLYKLLCFGHNLFCMVAFISSYWIFTTRSILWKQQYCDYIRYW